MPTGVRQAGEVHRRCRWGGGGAQQQGASSGVLTTNGLQGSQQPTTAGGLAAGTGGQPGGSAVANGQRPKQRGRRCRNDQPVSSERDPEPDPHPAAAAGCIHRPRTPGGAARQ